MESGNIQPKSSPFQAFAVRFLTFWVCLVMLTLPYPYEFLPEISELTRPFFEGLTHWTGPQLFHLPANYAFEISSDTTGMYLHFLHLMIISVILSLVLGKMSFTKAGKFSLKSFLPTVSAYFLALHLLIYGFSKVFKVQFYLPEPNILFTPLGEVPRDLLYWTSMGVSYEYTVFAGMLELAAGGLLLFRRTRIPGALLALAVMGNVVAINFAYDINVKLHSSFLFLLGLILIWPFLKPLARFFAGNPAQMTLAPRLSLPGPNWVYPLAKGVVIVLLLLEGLIPYLKTGNFNDDLAERPLLHGAYEVKEFISDGDTLAPLLTDSRRWKRFFIHRQGYFIVQGMQDKMLDFALETDMKLGIFSLKDPRSGREWRLAFGGKDDDGLSIRGRLGDHLVEINAKKMNWRGLNLLKNEFHWTTDGLEK
ncbi:MAG: hypothetical protein H6581_13135 [Bacteroidia bacterium]|nr:hypothetical protein [Bacteroidia bacterium]